MPPLSERAPGEEGMCAGSAQAGVKGSYGIVARGPIADRGPITATNVWLGASPPREQPRPGT
ncbi:hypothetical protein GCM10010510_01600 [Streptomyces anandii JCM 4720]|nr:hypothetical protein GCM10010510_01600 [Streptomyces anandii JCM 4720]